MVQRMRKGVRWVKQGMLNIIGTHPAPVMGSIRLQRRPESGLVHICQRALMPLITKWVEAVLVLHLHLVVVWKWIRSPVPRLDNAVRRITEVIEAIFNIVGLVEALVLRFPQIVVKNVFHDISCGIRHR
jgi:hypothetical protein